MRAGITPRMCPLPIPRMSKNEATESQRQSEAIRGNQRQSEAIRGNQAAPQTLTSGAIRRNQMQSGAIRCNQELCVSVFSCFGRAARACVLCFCVLGWHNGPVFCVFVFWQTPLKTQHGAKRLARAALAPRAESHNNSDNSTLEKKFRNHIKERMPEHAQTSICYASMYASQTGKDTPGSGSRN